MKKARVLLFTGDGKGKTTASLGMVLRAAGHGMKVLVLQFIKGNRSTGEVLAAPRLGNVEIIPTGRGFLPTEGSPSFKEHEQAARQGFELARKAVKAGTYDLLILDEICLAVADGLLSEGEVLDLLDSAKPEMIIVMTGRSATSGLINAADTVTEMRCIKRGLDAGIRAQKGVEN